MKIAAVVILYHPAKDAISNIKSYYDSVDQIFVFDNTEDESFIQADLKNLSKAQIFHDGENMGISARLNSACLLALSQQFDWLLTMDQDSSFSGEAISSYISCFKSYSQKENVAMFGTQFTGTPNDNADCSVKEIEKLITSGSLVNLSLFSAIGGFDEKLFIDGVDYDYCFRAQIKGYRILQFNNIHINHAVGKRVNRASIKTLFLIKKKKEIHSALRCYYMYRNMLYLNEKYKTENKMYIKEIRGYVLSRIKVSLLYGRNTRDILKYLKVAKSDFKNNKMGKIGAAE